MAMPRSVRARKANAARRGFRDNPKAWLNTLPSAQKVVIISEFRPFQILSKNYKVGNTMLSSGVWRYILVDRNTDTCSEKYLTGDEIKSILFLETFYRIILE